MAGRPTLRRDPTETELEDAVVALAKLLGWKRHHQRPGMNRRGQWASQIKGDPGFPDLVLVHPRLRRVLFVELKAKKGRYSDGQEEWADALERAGATYYLWTPAEWFDGTIDTLLTS